MTWPLSYSNNFVWSHPLFGSPSLCSWLVNGIKASSKRKSFQLKAEEVKHVEGVDGEEVFDKQSSPNIDTGMVLGDSFGWSLMFVNPCGRV